MSKLQVIVSTTTNPYINVSVENYMMSLPDEDVVTLYLWKNRRTVVIGQNQNPYAECNVELLEGEGGFLMRRRTGGGAVYHDGGNINFSFIVPKRLYDLHKQFSVIQQAVESYGLHTQISGRNDLLCEGSKFSGNAFGRSATQWLHHGTILIKVNKDDLQRYLHPKPAKLLKNGVDSVASRVVNLSDLAPVTSENIKPKLIASFETVYGAKATELSFEEITKRKEVVDLIEMFSSDKWLKGNWRSFKAAKSAQFDWGSVEIALTINEERQVIENIAIASDGLNTRLIDIAQEALLGASTAEKPTVEQLLADSNSSAPRSSSADSAEISKELSDIIDLIYQ